MAKPGGLLMERLRITFQAKGVSIVWQVLQNILITLNSGWIKFEWF